MSQGHLLPPFVGGHEEEHPLQWVPVYPLLPLGKRSEDPAKR